MDIFNFAIKMEQDGEKFYREMVSRIDDKGIQEILNMLADDEVKHARAIEQLRSRTTEMVETEILNKAMNVFTRMKKYCDSISVDQGQEALYRQAMKIEQNSIDFYLDRADQSDIPSHQTLFRKLAEEEKKHYRLLSGLADFVNRPKTWLENAEFYHLEEY